ncbi:MAG: hypothetical protein U1G08_10800 [Verrucomicrobiota bacterium]
MILPEVTVSGPVVLDTALTDSRGRFTLHSSVVTTLGTCLIGGVEFLVFDADSNAWISETPPKEIPHRASFCS